MQERLRFLNFLESGNVAAAMEMAASSREDKELFLAALGDSFAGKGNLSFARKFYVESIQCRPNPAAEFGLGSVLLAEGAVKESMPFLASSARGAGYEIKSLLKLGMARRLVGDIRGALAAYLQASSMGYDKHILDVNIAVLLSDLGETDRAGEYYERALSKCPDDPGVKFNCSLHLLARGDFLRGMELYESRPWCFRGLGREWSGEHGENVLVLAEQGYGDLINFCRFIDSVKRVSGRVALACDGNVSGFVSQLKAIDEIVGLDEESIKNASSSYPFYCRVMSIPRIMSLDLRSHAGSYLKPDPSRVAHWRGLVAGDRLNVGLCWQGGKRNHSEMMFNDRKRSVDLGLLEPVLATEGVNFYSLQKDWKEPHPKISDLMDGCGDFMDAASLVSCMDLVISVDTAMAHVAGSIGIPVWMLSRLGGCWRWGNSGESTFWYSSMRIFRQESMDDWSSAIGRLGSELAGLASGKAPD